MARYVALDPASHRDLRIDTDRIQSQGANERLVPVVLSEFSKLVLQCPIAFTKSEDTGNFVCVAVLGFEAQENLFWQDDKWLGIYTPLNILRQPFYIGQDANHSVVCIEQDAATVSKVHGTALFDAQGHATAYFEDVKRMLSDLVVASQATSAFVQKLVSYDLLVPLSLNITLGNGDPCKVRGLYTVDDEKLSSLDAQTLLDLHRRKYLTFLHMIVASTGHFLSLLQRKNDRNDLASIS